jgi:DtxR family Mn-dependent transcriptional regulator
MYLITVARATESGTEGPIPISQIADTLAVSVPSANEMVRKLDGRGLLTYEPYRGVRLSETGNRIAGQVLRTRRLWATFLAQHLGFSPADADDQACHLEHATSPEAANRLAAFLGNPQAGPLGRPIPAATTTETRRSEISLSDLPVGATAEVVSIAAAAQAGGFLAAEGITAGCRVAIAGSGPTGVLVEIGDHAIHLNPKLAATVKVRAKSGGEER